MFCLYTNNTLYQEKSLVINYFKKRAEHKNYPHTYVMAVYNLINQVYEHCLLNPSQKMLSHPLVQQAIIFSTHCHQGQERKFIHLPYIIHPVEMASRLSSIVDIEPEQLVAALLHDVVEDCGVSIDFIAEKFGALVAYYVHYLTDPAKVEDGNRVTRMSINLEHLKLSNEQTKNIKITDLLSNTRSIIFCDPNFCSVYVPSMEITTDYLQSIGDSLHPELLHSLINTVNSAKHVLKIQQNFNIVKLDKNKNTIKNRY